MSLQRLALAIGIVLAASAVVGCQNPKPEAPRKTIGHAVTRLGVRVGGTWLSGYSVEVAPQEYVMVEHKNCPDAKDLSAPKDVAKGICVFRITREQSDRFEAAMERFKKNAMPLQNFSLDDPWTRPDGKPCQSQSTDATMISLTWTGTEGIKMATFYTGCDAKEFASFYKDAMAVTDALPIQQIISDR